jgi:hypothetical protein
MKVSVQLLLAVCALALLSACGTPGGPSPPALELPRPSGDLSAARKGDKVTLSWTPARKTTDGRNTRFKKLGPTLVCRGVNQFPMATCAQQVGQVQPVPTPEPVKGAKPPSPAMMTFADTVSLELQQKNPTGSATYAVSATNKYGRSAGFSNQVTVPLAPTLPPPATVSAEVTADGVAVTFRCSGNDPVISGLRYRCRLYRQEQGSTASVVVGTALRGPHACDSASGGTGLCRIIDHGFEWEKTYRYWVTVVTEVLENGAKIAEVEGEDSRSATVIAADVFPPEVPKNLEAVASGVGQKPFIDLSWTPDTDADLAGYIVYCQEPGSNRWSRISSKLFSTPAYRDENIVPGRTYTYVVTAVDVRGHESDRSEPSSETVPQ